LEQRLIGYAGIMNCFKQSNHAVDLVIVIKFNIFSCKNVKTLFLIYICIQIERQ